MGGPGPGDDRTSLTLLGRLRTAKPDAIEWSEFVRRYGPQVDRWCRRWGLQGADAEDVTQTVMARLATRIRDFKHERPRSFRTYLKSITHYAWQDLLESRRRAPMGTGQTTMLERLVEVEARDDLVTRLADAYDHELLDLAMDRVRLRVEPRTWEAFRLSAIEGLSGAAVAAAVGMEVATAYKARSKVQKMLHEEVRRLGEDAGP
jgi:RNA polymerase sigma factor (sigma-70 family)